MMCPGSATGVQCVHNRTSAAYHSTPGAHSNGISFLRFHDSEVTGVIEWGVIGMLGL
jgi:hypothetical protein